MGAPDQDSEKGIWVGQGRYLGSGLTAVASTVLFAVLGFWLDGKLGTTPLFIFAGALFGAAAGFYNLYVHLVVEPEHSEEEEVR